MKVHWLLLLVLVLFAVNAPAAPINLGTATTFGLLAGSGITNDPTNAAGTIVQGDVGSSPTPAVTGFPPGVVLGTLYTAPSAATAQAQSDLVIAYNAAASAAPNFNLTGQDLGGMTLVPGVYFFSSSAGLTGTLTLDAQGDPNAQWVFQIGSTLITGTNSNVMLINGASPCNVFWQVGSSATIQTNNNFVGNIMALASITLNGGTLNGRALARNGAVTISNSETVVSGVCVPSHPCVSITKQPNRTQAAVNDEIIYTYTICNCGSTPITVDSVTDSNLGNLTTAFTIANGGSTLSVGLCTVFTVSHTVTVADANPLVNTAIVSVHDTTGSTSDTATASVDITPTTPTTCVSMVKVADRIVASVGDLVTYNFTICNCGTTTLTVDSVIDSNLGNLTTAFTTANGGATMAGGTCMSFTATHTVLASDPNPLSNVVTVNAHNNGTPVTASDNWDIAIAPGPCLSVAKVADRATASVGDTVLYKFTVCNCGTPPVTVDSIIDTHFGDLNAAFITANGGSSVIPSGACVDFTIGRIVLFTDTSPLWNKVTVIAHVNNVVLTETGESSVDIVPRVITQAVPATSGGWNWSFLGYHGIGPDVTTATGGVFSIYGGNKWSNFIKAARDQWPGGWTVKNVVLRKTTPSFIQCSEVYAPKTVTQQGTNNIRTWWPLMYEAPGTTFTLNILYGTGQVRIGSNPNDIVNYDDGTGPATVHTDIWKWTVDADLNSLSLLLDVFHSMPFGLDEVPLISNEALYKEAKQLLSDTNYYYYVAQDTAAAADTLSQFELVVADACISSSPILPYPGGSDSGIAQTPENPACCKLLVDVEYIAKKLGIFVTSK